MRCLAAVVLAMSAVCAAGCAMGDSHERDGGSRRRVVDAGGDPMDGGGVLPSPDGGGRVDGGGGGPGTDAGGVVGTDAGPPRAPDGGACPAGLMRCGVVCVDLRSDVGNCGACERTCSVPSATPACVASACAVGMCAGGHADCNGSAMDGCEGSCAAGAACMTACGSTGTTSCASICAPSCTPPAETCDARDENCDGTCDEGVAGCRAGVHRSYHPVTSEHFYTTSLAEAGCCGFTVEFANFFYVYAAAHTGLVGLHRCVLSTGKHFYTTAAGCEGSPGSTDEGVMGYIAPSATCGATELYRLWHPTAGHFYTIDAGERDYAVSTIGFVYEGVAGWVWRTP